MNIRKIIVGLFISISFQSIVAQKDGYWDKERATKREVVVAARDRIVIKTEDLPVGTTEVVYRITLLDQNQQMSNSLVSVLKSIPDPTGISQGSAGAVFLLSKISGEDKCKYAIFSNETAATDYQKKGTTTKACYNQSVALSKDAKGLSAETSLCLLPNSNAMWFGFESNNWILNQKIVLEVVPWVNTRLASGWTLEHRRLIINECKTSDLAKKIIPADEFCVCVLEKLQKEYKFQEFQKLLPIEKSKAYTDLGNKCLSEAGGSDKTFSDLRAQSAELLKQNKYTEAIDKIGVIIVYGKAKSEDFNRLGYAYIMTKQYSKAIKSLKDGEEIDETDLLLQVNLAHSYMLNTNFKMAKSIHKKYQLQNVTASLSWTQKVQQDFDVFTKAGLPTDDFDRVLRLLKK